MTIIRSLHSGAATRALAFGGKYKAVCSRSRINFFPLMRGLSTTASIQSKSASSSNIIYQSPIARPMSLLKFMSLAGSIGSCLSTTAFTLLQNTAILSGIDIDTTALTIASVASVASTTGISLMFRPFVCHIECNAKELETSIKPGGNADQLPLNEQGVPKFNDIVKGSRKSESSHIFPVPSHIDTETEIVFYTVGLSGISFKSTRVKIKHLRPSICRMGTWEIRPQDIEKVNKLNNRKIGYPAFIVAWKVAPKDGTDRKVMARIDSLIKNQK